MATNVLNTSGPYAVCIASASVADNAMSAGAASSVIAAIPTEAIYPMLDFRCEITSGTPTAGNLINLYRRSSDGTNQANAPTTTYPEKKVGEFVLPASTGFIYLSKIEKIDIEDTFYAENKGGATLTFVISMRGSSYKT